MGALDDIRVLDCSDPKGHFAGKLLAGLGADVIKIEPPDGDLGRSYGPVPRRPARTRSQPLLVALCRGQAISGA